MAVHYSMLCNPRNDGDGRAIAEELRKQLTESLVAFTVNKNKDEFVRMTSCRYLSDGDIRVCFIMGDTMPQQLTDYLYAHQDELGIDIMEAGKD
jgi:hypothetical protein